MYALCYMPLSICLESHRYIEQREIRIPWHTTCSLLLSAGTPVKPPPLPQSTPVTPGTPVFLPYTPFLLHPPWSAGPRLCLLPPPPSLLSHTPNPAMWCFFFIDVPSAPTTVLIPSHCFGLRHASFSSPLMLMPLSSYSPQNSLFGPSECR
jgi:hypothetical protein